MQNEFDYKKYINLIFKHKLLFVLTALTFMSGAVVISYVSPKIYEAKATVFVEKNVIMDLVKGIAVTPSMDDTIRVLNIAITGRPLVQKVVDELDMSNMNNYKGRERLIENIQKHINVRSKDNLFQISYQDSDPRFARDFANTLVRCYIAESVSSKRDESYGAIKFLSEQLGTMKQKLDQGDSEINRYKAQKGVAISIDEGRLYQDINSAQQKLYDIQLRRRYLEGIKPSTRKASDPLQSKLITLQKRLDELRTEYTESYPEVIKTKSDIETIKGQIDGRKGLEEEVVDPQELEKVNAELQALKLSEESLKRSIGTNQALLQSVPGAKAGMAALELDVKKRKELYEQIMARHGQSEVSTQMEVQDKTTTFKIVEPAIIPIKPIRPNRVKIMLVGIVAGIAAGFCLLLLIDFFDKTVKTVDALKALGVQVLAVIPQINDPQLAQKERRKDMRLYIASGAYFSMIVALLALEFLDKSPVDRIIRFISG